MRSAKVDEAQTVTAFDQKAPMLEPEEPNPKNIPDRSGEAVAAMLSIVLGMLALTAAHWWSAADPARANLTLLRWSSWLPSGLLIGPYGGKELAALGVWPGSWLLLFVLLRNRELPLRPWTLAFVVCVLLLMVLLWPPLYHSLYGWPA